VEILPASEGEQHQEIEKEARRNSLAHAIVLKFDIKNQGELAA
jgi:hypothetical protein